VAGPTGSGKSTTLCATLKIITTPDKNIITVEDPVEYEIQGIQQSPVREDIGYSFETGLRSILRHDPDIIMIGEMRDLDSAEMAVRSALTGHLVFSTIHTNDSISAFTRLTDMGIKKYLVFAVIRMVLSQRLVRVLCNNCKKAENIEKSRFQLLGLDQEYLDKLPEQVTIYNPAGCDTCKNIGYQGRKAIFEVLDAAELVKNIRDPDMPLKDLSELAVKLGLVTLRASALRKVLEGKTSMDEVLKVTADF
jgi:type II secretory ATPase GspE/PulE/Tfp pilus assembly ATPase PilB-like protein